MTGVSEEALERALDAVASVRGVAMDGRAAASDILRMSEAWPDERVFVASVDSLVQALEHICGHRVEGSPLTGAYGGWRSYHFQSRRSQHAEADMRVIYRRQGPTTEVLAFGHRYAPDDLYRSVAATRHKAG